MKNSRVNVVIILAKCNNFNKTFGIRMEESDGTVWKGTWAFPIKESTAHKEKYDKNTIHGSINFDPSYPGCPFCEAKNIFLCNNCNSVSCYDGKSKIVTCPTCHNRGRVEGFIERLNAGQDR